MSDIYIARQGTLIPVQPDSEKEYPWLKPAMDFIAWYKGEEANWQLKSSGSTGTPKLITWQRVMMEYSALRTLAFLGLTGEKLRIWVPISCEHAGGIMMLFRALLNNAEIWLSEPDSDPWKDLPENQLPDFASLVPLQMETLLKKPSYVAKATGISCILVGGAPVSESLQQLMAEWKNAVWHTYGMTETYSHIALRKLSYKKDRWFQTIDPATLLRSEPDGTLGIKSPLTENTWLKTNDVIEMASSGKKFRFLGRADQMINSGGVKVNPLEVEKAFQDWLYPLGITLRIGVTGVPDQRYGEKIVALLENNPSCSFVIDSWKEVLQSKLPPYHQPKAFYVIDQWPEAANGKTDRNTLHALALKLNLE